MNKLLTIAIPTYNRAYICKENITRLAKPELPEVDIMVIDNASTDETPSILGEIIEKSNGIIYKRNETNLGMEGNFLECYKIAKSKYLWILGDDDLIELNKLDCLLALLRTDPGLVHISPKNLKGTRNIYDGSEFLSLCSYWLTFISSNIFKVDQTDVHRTKYDYYHGTFLCVTRMYIDAIFSSPTNVITYDKFWDGGQDLSRNGGYNFFKVFGENFCEILIELRAKKVITGSVYKTINHDLFANHIAPNFKRYVLSSKKNNYDLNGAIGIILRYFGGHWANWRFVARKIFL